MSALSYHAADPIDSLDPCKLHWTPSRKGDQDEPSGTNFYSRGSPPDLEDLTVPGKPHEVLAGTVGEWSLSIRVWSAPEGEPTETTGTATGRWILGERFVETTYQGEVMGRPFEALKIEGYEKAKEQYVSTWRDNLGNYTLIFEGACGDDCSKRTMIASFQDPISKQQLRIKGLTTLTGDDSYSYESYILMPDGSEFKNMELLAERRSQ
jgi:hypothetical protein